MPDSLARTCPKCATVIPASFPEGLCPKCLLEQATPDAPVAGETQLPTLADLDASENTIPVAPPVSGSTPVRLTGVPSLETLRGMFPELEILDVLGAGGMGAVYKARQPRLNRLVALKIMVAAPGHETDFALRFEREAQVLARLNHPHIVILYDFGELGPERTGADPLFYFLMEHVDGTDLGQLIKSRELKPAQALAIVPQICEALQYAHDQGITHRDIKPANILLDKKGTVKIADFGLAKMITGTEEALMTGLTQTGTAMGTPHYMAPEQWEHPEQVDHRADIYALGVVFYEMLTGERPAGVFEPPSKKSKSPVDRKLDGVVMRAMDKNPDRRYQQAGQIGDDVTRISGANKRRQASGESREKSRLLHPFISLGTAATLGVGAWMLWPEKGENPGREAGSPAAAVPPPTALGGPSALPSKPGRLRAVGVMLNGQPHDLSKFAAYDDFVDVAGGRDRWVALRANGETVSSDGQSDLKNIRRIVRAVSVSDVYAFITTAGKILFREGSPHELPDELKKAVVVDAVLGSEHGLALTDAGVVVTFGTRYQETHGDPADSQRWGTPRWPQPPVQALRKVKTVAATTTHAASLHEDGTVSVWGWEGLVRWDTDPRQKAIREIASSQDGLWMLDAAGLVWQLPLPRNPSPQQPVSGAGKVRLMDEVRATRIGERCWLRVTGEWCQEASVCRWIFQQNALRRDTVFSLRTTGFSQNGQASLLWIEPKPNVVSTIAAVPGRAVGPPAAAAPPQTAQGWQDLLSETSALQLSGGSTVTNGKLTLPSRSGIAVAAASNLGEKPQDGAVRMIVTFIQGKPQPSLIARQSAQNARYAALVRQGDRVLLHRVREDNKEIEVGSYPLPAPLREGERYELELRAFGSRIRVHFNGAELGGIEDASVTRGWFGVRQFGDAEVAVEALAFQPLDSSPMAGSTTPARPGRLRATGTMLNGRPPDLAKFTAFDDFVDVAASYESWVALRANGETLSSDGRADFEGIRKIARSYPQGGYPCFIDESGSLRFHPLLDMTLPASLNGRVVVDAACGSHHGVALLEDGQAVVFGRRYEEAVGDVSQAQGSGTPRWPQPEAAALQNVKGVAVTRTHAATLYHDGTVSVWGWEGPVKWQPEPGMKPVRQISSFHDELRMLDEAGQVWSFPLPRSAHPEQPVGFNGRVILLGKDAVRLRDHLWLHADGDWRAVEADLPTVETLESVTLQPETNFALLASISGSKPYGYALWIEPGAPGGAAGPPAAALPPPTALGGPSALPSAKPGRLRAAGTTANGKPHDLAKFAAHEDFVDVAGGWGRWVALRANGQTVSSDGRADFTDIAKIAASFNAEYGFITKAGKLVIPDYEAWELPSSLERGVVDAALGMQHGIALLKGGKAVVFGARYEGAVGYPANPKQYGTPRWPAPESGALENVKAVAATVTHAATLHEDGTLSLWGWEGPLKWEADPRQKPLRQLRSTEDGFWALDEAGQLWHQPVPRNPAPGQPVHVTGKPTLSQADVTHMRSRCWCRKSGQWVAHINTPDGMALLNEARISENTAFSLDGGLFNGKPFASLLWIEPGE